MTFIPALRARAARAPAAAARGRRLDGARPRRRSSARSCGGGGRAVLIGTAHRAGRLAPSASARIRTYGPTREYMARGQPAARPSRGDREALPRHGHHDRSSTRARPDSAKSLPVLQHMVACRPSWSGSARLAHGLGGRPGQDAAQDLQRRRPDPVPPARHPGAGVAAALPRQLAGLRALHRPRSRASLLIAYLRDDDSARVGPLVARARSLGRRPSAARRACSVLIAGGAGPTVLAVNEHTTHSKLLNILLVLTRRSTSCRRSSCARRSAACTSSRPIVVTMIVLFGALGWTGIRLDMGSATIIAMAAGIGADYAIYFLYRLREEYRRARATTPRRCAPRCRRRAAPSCSSRQHRRRASPAWPGLRYFGLRLFGTLMPPPWWSRASRRSPDAGAGAALAAALHLRQRSRRRAGAAGRGSLTPHRSPRCDRARPGLDVVAEVMPMIRRGAIAVAVLLLGAVAAARADETCMSPYMPKITGQEDYVYVWTLGVDGVGDGSDKLVTVGANPRIADLRQGGLVDLGRRPPRGAPRRLHRRPPLPLGRAASTTARSASSTSPPIRRSRSWSRPSTRFVKDSGGVVGPHTFFALPGPHADHRRSPTPRTTAARPALVEYNNDGEFVQTIWMPEDAEYGYDVRVQPRLNRMLTSSFTGWNNYMTRLRQADRATPRR